MKAGKRLQLTGISSLAYLFVTLGVAVTIVGCCRALVAGKNASKPCHMEDKEY